MEVVGVVAAVPALIELVVHSGSLIRDCLNASHFFKAVKGLDGQLSVLQEILNSINAKWSTIGRALPSAAELRSLGPVLEALREELESLNRLLAKAVAPRFLIRARMAINGFEKQLKERMSRIERIKTLMTLKMAEGIYASVTGKYL
jgi:hypothetical protein